MVSAKFSADFSSFTAAIDKAEVKLADFGKGADKVGVRLNAMSDALSGRKLVQDAGLMEKAVASIGGTSKLTASELERVAAQATTAIDKMKRLGIDVPPGLQKIADASKATSGTFDTMKSSVLGLAGAFGVGLSIGAVVNFGKAVLADADALVRLRDKTGLTLQALQKFQVAGDDAGNSVDEISSAIVRMQDGLVSGDKSAISALGKLGLKFEDIERLSPENRFIAISDAMRQIQDPAQQVNIAIDLFGKQGAAILPTLKRGFDDLKDSVVGMSDETVRAMAEAGDTIDRWWRTTKGVTAEAIVGFVRLAQSGFNPVTYSVQQLERETEALNLQLKAMTVTATAAAPKLRMVAPLDVQKMFSDLQIDIDNDAAALKKLATEAGAAAKKLQDDVAAAAKKASEELERNTDAVRKVEAGFFGLQTAVGAFDSSEIEAVKRTVELRAKIDEIERSSHVAAFGFKGMADGLKSVGQEADLVAPKLSASLTDSLKGIPDILIQAFTGGGGVSGALKAIGVQLGVDFGKALNDGLKSSIESGGNGFTAVTGKAAAATGALTGLGVAMSGASGKAAAASTAMAGVSVAAGAIGAGATIGGAVALGAATAGIGLAAVGAYVAIKHFLTDTEKKINPVRQKFVDLNGGLVELDKKAKAAGVTLTAMLKAKNVKEYEAAINALTDALQLQEDSARVLDATVEKYGLSLEELGPKFRQGKLDEAFGVLLQDLQILSAAGVDFDLVITKQAESFQALITTALKTGATIPAAMRPALQRMIELGLLTDESGEKLTDLERLTFAETLDEKFTTLIETINKLAEAISRNLGTAIAAIPTNITIGVGYDYEPYNPPNGGNYAANGGLVTATGVQYLAAGGNVLPFRARGTDTVPAMLTPGEGVVSKRGMRTLGTAGLQAINRGGGGGWTDQSIVSELRSLRADNAKTRRQLLNEQRRLPERISMVVRGSRR